MKTIYIFVEGRTEKAFKKPLAKFLETRLAGKMPRLIFQSQGGRVPKGEKLKRMVFACLQDKNKPADAVIALTDVYTGHKIEFQSALIAKKLMSLWVGDEPRFHPHVALHDFEAWLLPYWSRIQQLAGSKRKTPSANPEVVNHGKSPAYWLKEVFETGKNSKSRSYMKTIHVGQILDKQDLLISIEACPEFKSFINTILQLCDPATMIP